MITFNKLGRYGRLGNQMFQIASTIGIARKNGYEVGFPEWKNWDAKERFGSEEDIDMERYFSFGKYHAANLIRPTKEHIIPFGFHGFDIPDNVSLEGHLQSEKYFKHCEQEIRELFNMEYWDLETFADNRQTCAVHIRLGDFSNQAGYHPLQKKEYYAQAFEAIGKVDEYLIYSDIPDIAEHMMKEWFPETKFYMFKNQGKSAYDVLDCMHHNQHFICANSTFSWWAAWLATNPNKKVVMPKNWFGPAWTIPMPTEDIYFENAIVI